MTNGRPDRRAKWINIDGANYDATTNPKPTHQARFEITQEGYDMLNGGKVTDAGRESAQTKNILSKPNEPGAGGIGSDMIDDFNKHIKSVSVEEIQKCKKKRKR
ncbi:hypothetical protein QMW85_20715 [Cronobacter sakazakii]